MATPGGDESGSPPVPPERLARLKEIKEGKRPVTTPDDDVREEPRDDDELHLLRRAVAFISGTNSVRQCLFTGFSTPLASSEGAHNARSVSQIPFVFATTPGGSPIALPARSPSSVGSMAGQTATRGLDIPVIVATASGGTTGAVPQGFTVAPASMVPQGAANAVEIPVIVATGAGGSTGLFSAAVTVGGVAMAPTQNGNGTPTQLHGVAPGGSSSDRKPEIPHRSATQAQTTTANASIHGALGTDSGSSTGHQPNPPVAPFGIQGNPGNNNFNYGPPFPGMPVQNLQSGRTFLKMFARPIKQFMALPRGFAHNLRDELIPVVYLYGDTMIPHQVSVHDENGRLYFTNGWEAFALAERIQHDDVGLFRLAGPRTVLMRLYSRSGLEKPFHTRPVGVHPDAVPNNQPAYVPGHVLGMQYELGPKLGMTAGIMQQMVDIWVNRPCDHPLYAFILINTFVKKKYMYFGTKFSKMLPIGRSPAALFFGNNPNSILGAITRTAGDPLARVSAGFGRLLRFNGLVLGDIIVVRLRQVGPGFRVRFYRVAP